MTRRRKGEGSLLKRRGTAIWYAQYYDLQGRQVRFSTGEPIKARALVVLRKRMEESDRGLVAPDHKLTYGDLRAALLADYARKGNKSLLRRSNGEATIIGLQPLDAFFGYSAANPGPPALTITGKTADTFAQQRKKAGVGNAAINRSLAALRRMFTLAVKSRQIATAPVISLLKEPPARSGFVELSQFTRLIVALPTHLRPLITFLYYCGVRCGEALQITWPQVDLQRRVIRLAGEQTKNREPRTIPLPSVLCMLLSEQEAKEGRVFCRTNLKKEWHKACVRADLGTLTPVEGKPYDPHYEGLIIHDLRRSGVRNLVRAGVHQHVAMKISGHRTASVFQRYNIVDETDLANAMHMLEVKEAKQLPAISANLVQK